MCYGCWEEAGKPEIDTPAVRLAARRVESLRQRSEVGGHLHIVVDDWNLEDSHMDFCRKKISANRLTTDSRLHQAEVRCLESFADLTETERCSALALSEGFWVLPELVED